MCRACRKLGTLVDDTVLLSLPTEPVPISAGERRQNNNNNTSYNPHIGSTATVWESTILLLNPPDPPPPSRNLMLLPPGGRRFVAISPDTKATKSKLELGSSKEEEEEEKEESERGKRSLPDCYNSMVHPTTISNIANTTMEILLHCVTLHRRSSNSNNKSNKFTVVLRLFFCRPLEP